MSTTTGVGGPDAVTSTEAFAWDTLAGVPVLLSDGTHEYIYGLGSAPVAQVDTVTGAVTFLHGDLVGSTRSATDASGVQVGSWDYSTFGVTTTATGGVTGDGTGVTRFLFAGEYLDDSGLYYLRARFYDPVTASFLSVDQRSESESASREMRCVMPSPRSPRATSRTPVPRVRIVPGF